MQTMSQLIMRLELASRRCAIAKKSEGSLSLKAKLLFLLSIGICTPPDLIYELSINKSNLALLTRDLAKNGLAVKKRQSGDRREIVISPTKKGLEYLDSSLKGVEEACQNAFGGGYTDAAEKLNQALDILDLI